jgi:hypothetical protein
MLETTLDAATLEGATLLTAWLDCELAAGDETELEDELRLELLSSPPQAASVSASAVTLTSWGSCWVIFIIAPVTKRQTPAPKGPANGMIDRVFGDNANEHL